MKTDFTIRNAQHSDIQMLIELLRALFSIEEDFVFDEEKQRQGLEMMLEDQKNRCIFIAEFEQQVVGMISGQTLVSTAEGGISVLVEDVVIDQNYRRQGIGRELISVIESWAFQKGARRLQLLADINNSSALAFYKQLNWSNTRLMCLQKKDIQNIRL
ncbi:N-acetyltransferase [Clostridium polyendosporum]|uniref:N-acetyltransferase n=1 Tax=Clostridium polyendosporum TaxID=69208 RepID=A0A919VH94_9CLOT|nr:GNAT family N-acetyltransferase [Clostridium polyendosporum]GIM30017.1 N-acetyltransferase [Clostridium polyendosporum]